MGDDTDMKEQKVWDILQSLQEEGIYLWTEGETLKFRAEKNKLQEETKALLRCYKQDIIQILNSKSSNRGFTLTPIQYAYRLGRKKDYELGGIGAHYYLEYRCREIDVGKLEEALNHSIKRHDALRLVFPEEGMQQVLEEVPRYKISFTRAKEISQVLAIREELSHKSYELKKWPLFSFAVSHFEQVYSIHISFDCIILDAMSAKMLVEELWRAYEGIESEKLDFSFEMYQRNVDEYKKEKINTVKAQMYWQERIRNMPKAPKLKLKKELNQVKKPCFKRIEYSFSKEETQKLYDTSKKYKFTPSAIIAAVFLKTLSNYSENQDVTINMPIFNRFPLHEQVNQVLGDFTNISFASYFRNEAVSFCEEVKEIQKQFFKILQYRHYDGTKVLKELGKDKFGKAIMPVVFTCVLAGDTKQEGKPGFTEIYSLSQTPQVYLDHHVRDDGGFLKISWDYIEELFEPSQLEEMFGAYCNQINQIIGIDCWENL